MRRESTGQISTLFDRNIIFCDVGARWGLVEPWKSYRNCIDVVGFEPDQEEYEKLSKKKNCCDVILPHALFSEEKQLDLHLTKSRSSSSIFQPNFPFLERFPDADRCAVETEKTIQSTTLDTLYGNKVIQNIDFIKIDTQGAELDILRGGETMFAETILGAQLEVGFKSVYASQPLFSEIDIFARDKLGLELFDIRKTYWKYKEGQGIGPAKGQLIFGDALYLRDPYQLPIWLGQFDKAERNNKAITACFIGVSYGYPDYSLCLLEQLKRCQWMKAVTLDKLKKFVIANTRSIKYSARGHEIIGEVFFLLSKIFDLDIDGWGSAERHLGSRKKFGVFF